MDKRGCEFGAGLAQLQQKKLQDVFYLVCAPKVGTLSHCVKILAQRPALEKVPKGVGLAIKILPGGISAATKS